MMCEPPSAVAAVKHASCLMQHAQCSAACGDEDSQTEAETHHVLPKVHSKARV